MYIKNTIDSMQKIIDWNEDKNKMLLHERGVCFEDMLLSMQAGKVLAILPHPNAEKYPNQKIYVIDFQDYVYYVPFVEDTEKIFLKTIIPSRKYTRDYLK